MTGFAFTTLVGVCLSLIGPPTTSQPAPSTASGELKAANPVAFDPSIAPVLADFIGNPTLRKLLDQVPESGLEAAQAQSLLEELGAGTSWQRAALLGLIKDEAAGQLGPQKVDASPLRKRLMSHCLGQLESALREGDKDEGKATTLFERCLRTKETSIPAGRTFLIVTTASEKDRHVAVVAGGTSPELHLIKGQKGSAPSSRFLYAALVPRGVQLTVVIGADGEKGRPSMEVTTPTEDIEVLEPPVASACLELDVIARATEQIAVYLDGIRLSGVPPAGPVHARLPLARKEYFVHVVSGKNPVYARTIVRGDFDNAIGCHTLRVDVREQDAILLGDIAVNESCWQAGLDRNKVRAVAETFLKGTGKFQQQLGDLPGILSKATEALQNAARPGQQSATGPDRGRLDTVQNLAALGAEVSRVGFGKLIIIDVQCSRQSLENGWSVTVVARRLDARAAQQELTSPDTKTETEDQSERIVKTSIETAVQDLELAGSIDRALAPLVETPAIAFGELDERLRGFDGEKIQVSGYLPPPAPKETGVAQVSMKMRLVDDAHDRERCSRTNKAARLLATPGKRQEKLSGHDIGCEIEDSAGLKGLCTLKPSVPGEYLLEATLSRGTEEKARSYRCIRTTTFVRPVVWTQLNFLGSSLTRPSAAGRPEDFDQLALLTGVELRSVFPSTWWSFSGVIGYARSSHVRWTPPSWTDVTTSGTGSTIPPLAQEQDSQGRFAHRWFRNSILVGTSFSFTKLRLGLLCTYDQLCPDDVRWRTSGIDLKVLPVADIGWYRLDDASQLVSDVRTSSGTLDADLSVLGQAELTIAVSPVTRIFLGFHLSLLGVIDELFKDQAAERRKITNSLNLVWGLVFGGSTAL